MNEAQREHMQAVMAGLSGMVADTSGGELNFRPAESGEQPLNHGMRRQLGRYAAAGVPEAQVLEVIQSW